jgi:hypothetical protein
MMNTLFDFRVHLCPLAGLMRLSTYVGTAIGPKKILAATI